MIDIFIFSLETKTIESMYKKKRKKEKKQELKRNERNVNILFCKWRQIE